MMEQKPLKLRAADKEDLAVISACLQDAVIAIKETKYLPTERQFVLVANRFRWESADRDSSLDNLDTFERVHCGVCFDEVTGVRQRGLVQQRKGQIVSLLAVEPGDGVIDLTFSAGIAIRLEVENILCHVQDLDEPWPTQWRPRHPLDD